MFCSPGIAGCHGWNCDDWDEFVVWLFEPKAESPDYSGV
jgi:hypothetical protein